MSFLPRYIHIVNPKLKHTYLSFDNGGNLIIKSPRVSRAYLEQLLLKKADWINRSREKLLGKKGKTPDFSRKEELYFKGRSYPLILEEQTKKRTELLFDRETFLLRYPRYDEVLFQKHIDRFYKEHAAAFIPSLVEKYAREMALTPSDIRFRKTKRQWGSCSARNILSFNTMLMKLPPETITYVIVHELAHIRHKHHQKAFWELVASHIPDYREHIAVLKTYTTH